ncbi:1625_t:CDS:2 [Ambispora leptoticha]|uniref:1625_t:CDS:1 n=1 Tax=Ambispora leptoticha TaxID=144679 RepID=A0A9N9BJS1_9GLOM|nr:1625_t:CDS:2 [Ambispora leptoticha]
MASSSSNVKNRKPLSGTDAAKATENKRNRVKGLNSELSNVKQQLEITKNDNKNLLELKEQLEQRLEDCKKSKEQIEQHLEAYKKRVEETLYLKDLIISGLARKLQSHCC